MHLPLGHYTFMNAVPQFTISPLNITVIEGDNSTLEVCVMRVGQTSLDRNIIVTVQTGPKDGAIAQATGIYYVSWLRTSTDYARLSFSHSHIVHMYMHVIKINSYMHHAQLVKSFTLATISHQKFSDFLSCS